MENFLMILNVQILIAAAAFAVYIFGIRTQCKLTLKEAKDLIQEFKENAAKLAIVHNQLTQTNITMNAKIEDLANRLALSQMKR